MLARDARAALLLKRNLRGKAGQLEASVREVDSALAARDYQRVRRELPALDALVDELIRRSARSATRDSIESIAAAVLIAFALRAVVVEAFKIPSSSMYPTLEVNDHIFVNKFIYGLHIPLTSIKLLEWRHPHRGEVIVFQQPCTPDKDYIKRVVATEGETVEVRCNVVYVNGQPIEHQLVQGQGCTYDDYDENNGRWFPKPCSEYAERVDGHEYHTYHDDGRPRRDDELARTGALAQSDPNDFPRRDGDHMPPSCLHQADGESVEAPNQQTGEVVETKHVAGACDVQLHYVVPPGHVFAMGDNRANSKDSRVFGAVPVENIRGKALFIWLSYRYWNPLHWGGMRWSRIGSFVP
ncbi:MAG TPA: signal peptidase I [Kofleriaceae bacterium]|nr:signal peptidase I [Kofleriaceae bacterium]